MLGRTGIKKWSEPLEAYDPASDFFFSSSSSVLLTVGVRTKNLKCRCTLIFSRSLRDVENWQSFKIECKFKGDKE